MSEMLCSTAAMEKKMLGKWTEILPLFVIRWLALRYCERVPFEREGNARVAAVARPDVLVRVPPGPAMGCTETGDATKDPRGCWNVRRQHAELETLALYKSLADEYGLSIFKDLKDLTTEIENLRAQLKTYEGLGGAADDMQLLRMGYAAARLEIESLRGKGWQSIETAPKDGTLILAAIHIHCSDGTAAWQRHAIYFDAERNITYTDGGDETGWDFDDYQYWMPLPAAPAEGESQ